MHMQMMDEVLALVDELVACITQCGFRIFDPLQNPLWETTREEFNSMDANVQDATMNLINTSFKCVACVCLQHQALLRLL